MANKKRPFRRQAGKDHHFPIPEKIAARPVRRTRTGFRQFDFTSPAQSDAHLR